MNEFEPVAALVQRLSVLTAAGIPPLSAWRYVATDDAPEQARRVVAGLHSAHDLPQRLVSAASSARLEQRSAWAALAATWAIATESGAALSATLARLADVLRALAQSTRDVEVALAGPTATSRIVLTLPAFGVALGMLLGFDIVGIFATVPGLICLVVGGTLIVLGARWTGRLVRDARDIDATPGLVFDLLAVALSGGASVERARKSVAEAGQSVGIEVAREPVDALLDFATRAGVPAAVLLRSEADDRRRAAAADAARTVARLEARLLMPLGVCVLPAFVVVGVVPIALAIVSSTALAR